MATCSVVGGAGFIGSHLAIALARAGHRVRVLDRAEAKGLAFLEQQGGVEIVRGDFLSGADHSRALAGTDALFHLACTTLPQTSNNDPAQDLKTNLLGTVQLIEQCRLNGVRKVIFVSSGGTVYGVPGTTPVDESHPTHPTCAYGIHKLAIEKYLDLARLLHGLDYCVVRPANLYGERQRPDRAFGAVAVFLHRAMRGEPIHIWGDGSIVRDYVYVGDAVEAMVKAMAHTGEHRVFNIGSGVGTSLNELVEKIAAVIGRRVVVEHAPARPFDVPVNVLDASLAKRALGWSARTQLADGIRKTHEWLRLSG